MAPRLKQNCFYCFCNAMPCNAHAPLGVPTLKFALEAVGRHMTLGICGADLLLGHRDPAVWEGWTGLAMVGWGCKVYCGT